METCESPTGPATPEPLPSPERVNAKRPPCPGPTPAQTPSLEFGKMTPIGSQMKSLTMGLIPTIPPFQLDFQSSPKSPFRHSRTNSDAVVQGMVARFDKLSVKDWKANSDVAVKRAELAREMAELESSRLKEQVKADDEDRRKVREETRGLKKELDESRQRERKVSKRLEILMEELHRVKETQSHTVAVYDKEIRKSRKDAFKVSSSLVKSQEELKAARAHFDTSQSNVEMERLKSSKLKQEALATQDELVSSQDQLHRAQQHVKTLEAECERLKTCLKEDEVVNIAAQGYIALPPPERDDDDLLLGPGSLPAKSIGYRARLLPKGRDSDKENESPLNKTMAALEALQEDLITERLLRQRAVDQIDFMRMECQFQCCSCRIAEEHGEPYIHDNTLLPAMARIKKLMAAKLSARDLTKLTGDTLMMKPPTLDPQASHASDEQELTTYSPGSGTFRRISIAGGPPSSGPRLAQEKQQVVPSLGQENSLCFGPILGPRPESEPETSSNSIPASGTAQSIDQSLAQLSDSLRHSIPSADEPNSRECFVIQHAPQAADGHASGIRPEQKEQEYSKEQTIDWPTRPIQTHRVANFPRTAQDFGLRTITTTTTIPMQFSPVKKQISIQLDPALAFPPAPHTVSHPLFRISNDENQPPGSPLPGRILKEDGTIDRAAALEIIRQRRGRARSMALGHATPRAKMVEGNMRRDISAPTASFWK